VALYKTAVIIQAFKIIRGKEASKLPMFFVLVPNKAIIRGHRYT